MPGFFDRTFAATDRGFAAPTTVCSGPNARRTASNGGLPPRSALRSRPRCAGCHQVVVSGHPVAGAVVARVEDLLGTRPRADLSGGASAASTPPRLASSPPHCRFACGYRRLTAAGGSRCARPVAFAALPQAAHRRLSGETTFSSARGSASELSESLESGIRRYEHTQSVLERCPFCCHSRSTPRIGFREANVGPQHRAARFGAWTVQLVVNEPEDVYVNVQVPDQL